MLNLTLEETKQKHKEMWTMISDVLKVNSCDILDKRFNSVVCDLKEYCLKVMGYVDVKPDAKCFLCDYTNKNVFRNEDGKYFMCPGMGKCKGYSSECLGGLYMDFCDCFENGNYEEASEKAYEIANLKLDALDLLPFN